MKQERFDELVQNGYLICMSLFIFFALLGWILDNEILIWVAVFFLLYIPAMVCIYCVQGTNDSYKDWKKKRKKEKRLAECTSLRCRHCDKIYRKEELDVSPTSILRCPQCNKKLVPYE